MLPIKKPTEKSDNKEKYQNEFVEEEVISDYDNDFE